MGLIGEVGGVFDFFQKCFYAFPNAPRILIIGTFGLVVLIAVMNSFRR